MATVKMTSSKTGGSGGTGGLQDYLEQEEKTELELITGKDCDPLNFAKEFQVVKELNGQTDGRQHYHIVQSFEPGETTPTEAHKIGCQMLECEQFKGFQAVCVTHTDKDHIHNHIVINSVSYETGNKFHQSKNDLMELKEFSNKLCRENGLKEINLEKPALERKTMAEHQLLENGEKSWKEELRKEILKASYQVNNIEELAERLEKKGIEVKIQNKDLKYKAPSQEKFCGGRQLGELYTREYLEKSFNIGEEIIENKREIRDLEIDISSINRQKNKIIEIQNEYKETSESIEKIKSQDNNYSLFEKITGEAKKQEELKAKQILLKEMELRKLSEKIQEEKAKLKGFEKVENLEEKLKGLQGKNLKLELEKTQMAEEKRKIYKEKNIEQERKIERTRGMSR
jgi:hypothetical protein